MPLPANLSTCTFVGRFLDSLGDPVAGTVVFAPAPPVVLDSGSTPPVSFAPSPVRVFIDASGDISATVPATDDADISPTGWTYQVTVNIHGEPPRRFNTTAPAGGTVDLTSITGQVGSATGTATTIGLFVGATVAETITGTIATKAVTPAGLEARIPYVDVRSHGAACDGVTNDAAAVRLAATAAMSSKRALFFPPDSTCLLDSVDANNNFVTLTEGLEIFGGSGATIKIGASVTSWNGVFGTAALLSAVDMSGLNVHDLTFDGNSGSNPINENNPSARRYIVHAWNGDDIRIHDCHVKDWDGRNLFLIDGRVNGIENVYVYNIVGKNLGGAYWHDHSAIFASADYVSCYGNQLEGVDLGSTVPSSAWTAYELHGRLVECHNNVCEFYFSFGPIVSLYTAQPGEDSRGYHWNDNIAIHAGAGFTLWPQVVGTPITDVHIHHNTIDIDIDRWPTAAIGTTADPDYFPGIVSPAGHYGLGLIVGNSYVQRFSFDDNTITWRTHAGVAHVNDCGVWWVHSTSQASSGPVDKNCSISRNKFINTPSAGILVRWFFGLAEWDICDNLFHNIGSSAFGANYQAGMTILDTNSLTVASHVAIEDLRFNRNKFIDDQAVHTLLRLLLLAGGSSKTVSLGFTSGSATVTFTGTDIAATDIRSNIESASAVLAAANRIIASINTTNHTFAISGNASATVTENATITGGNGNTANVELLDNNVRIEDGTAIRYFEGQASGGVQHPAFTGHNAIVRARGAGTPESNQQGGIGSQWVRTDGGAATSFYVKEANTTTAGWVGK